MHLHAQRPEASADLSGRLKGLTPPHKLRQPGVDINTAVVDTEWLPKSAECVISVISMKQIEKSLLNFFKLFLEFGGGAEPRRKKTSFFSSEHVSDTMNHKGSADLNASRHRRTPYFNFI